MPWYIFNYTFMGLKWHSRVQSIIKWQPIREEENIKSERYLISVNCIEDVLLSWTWYIPQANLMVMGTTQKVPLLKEAPRQTIPFFIMTPQSQIRVTTKTLLLPELFGTIEHINLRATSLSADNIWVLRHAPRSIHLPINVNPLSNLYLQKNKTKAQKTLKSKSPVNWRISSNTWYA